MKDMEGGTSKPEWLELLRNRLEELMHPKPGNDGKKRLLEVLVEMGNLLQKHRGEMPNELVHYLERRSYEKAAQYCAGEISIPRGKCVPKA